jgi:hypothetical protein
MAAPSRATDPSDRLRVARGHQNHQQGANATRTRPYVYGRVRETGPADGPDFDFSGGPAQRIRLWPPRRKTARPKIVVDDSCVRGLPRARNLGSSPFSGTPALPAYGAPTQLALAIPGYPRALDTRE